MTALPGLEVTPEDLPYIGLRYVQPVIMLADSWKPASYIDALHAATLASVLAYATEIVTYGEAGECWDSWMQSGRHKTILRANPRDFNKLVRGYSDQEHSLVRVGRAQALGLQPVAGKLSRPLSRLDECRAVFPDRPSADPVSARPSGSPIVVIDPGLGMHAGQAAAAAAHSLLTWFTSMDADSQASWYDPGCPFSVIAIGGEDFRKLCIYSSVEQSVSYTPAGKPASFLLPPREIKIKHRY